MCNNYFLMNQDSFNCRIDRTMHEVCISFQTSRKVFLGRLDKTRAKKVSFPLNFSNDTLIVFLPCAS